MANFLEDYLGLRVQVFDQGQVHSSDGLNFLRLSVDDGMADAMVRTASDDHGLARYLSPVECVLFDENSGNYNSSRIKEAPNVPNALRVAIQSIDYAVDSDQAITVANETKTMLCETLRVRSDFAYFLGFGKYFCYASEAVQSPFHLDLECADPRFRSSSVSQYLIPIKIGGLRNPSVLDDLVSKFDQSSGPIDRPVLKQNMYDCARVDFPMPFDPKMLLRLRTLLLVSGPSASCFFEEAKMSAVPTHEGVETGCFGGPVRFKRGSYNVLV